MTTVILKDGSKVDIYDIQHLVDTIREHMGHDMATLLESMFNGYQEAENMKTKEQLYAEARTQTDCDCYEASLESQRNTANDMAEQAIKIRDYVSSAKRLDKTKVIKDLDWIYNEFFKNF